MNNIRSSYLKLGIAPLHLYINCMECILHIAYKLDVKAWLPRGMTTKNTLNLKKTKKELGINVNKPLAGGQAI